MGMSIDEIILTEKEIAENFQRYCDETEVIDEELERCKNAEDYHSTIANTMSKYQQIEQAYSAYLETMNPDTLVDLISTII